MPTGTPINLNALGDNGVILGKDGADKLNANVGDYVAFSLNNQFHIGIVKGIAPNQVLDRQRSTRHAIDADELVSPSGTHRQTGAHQRRRHLQQGR